METVLIFHNSYKYRGGEDYVIELETDILQRAGYRVRQFIVANKTIGSVADKIRTFRRSSWNYRFVDQLVTSLDVNPTDTVCHIHNFFPLFSPYLHHALSRRGFPIVQTLHNYRLICPASTLMRNNAVCEDCIGRYPWPGIWHRCYRDSTIGSLAVAQMIWKARRRRVWHEDVDAFIALTDFARNKLADGGVPREKIFVKPNFSMPIQFQRKKSIERKAVFAGRISEEKGIRLLVETWKKIPDIDLLIIGDGPLLDELTQNAPSNVHFLGYLSRCATIEHIAQADVMIAPSLWYEGFPMTIVEAYSVGTPVIASRLGSLSEIVQDKRTGRLFNPSDQDSMLQAIMEIFSKPEEMMRMRVLCKQEYEAKYTPEANRLMLENIYRAAIDNRNA